MILCRCCLFGKLHLIFVSNCGCFFLLINRSDGNDGIAGDDDKKWQPIQEYKVYQSVNLLHPFRGKRSKVYTLIEVQFVWMLRQFKDHHLSEECFVRKKRQEKKNREIRTKVNNRRNLVNI